jgi:hypothetical protein
MFFAAIKDLMAAIGEFLEGPCQPSNVPEPRKTYAMRPRKNSGDPARAKRVVLLLVFREF